jgi:hypothetical protein
MVVFSLMRIAVVGAATNVPAVQSTPAGTTQKRSHKVAINAAIPLSLACVLDAVGRTAFRQAQTSRHTAADTQMTRVLQCRRSKATYQPCTFELIFKR